MAVSSRSFWNVTVNDIARIRNVSYTTARKELKYLKAELLVNNRPLFLRDIASYYDVTMQELEQILFK